MLPIALGLVGIAYVLGWSALTGGSIVDELRSVLTGTPSDDRERYRARRERKQDEADALTASTPGGYVHVGPVDGVEPDGDASSSTPGGYVNVGAPPASGTPTLVAIGQGSHRLAPDAAAAFKRAEARVGRQIKVTDSYRSSAQQAECHRRKPTLCAPAGSSLHERGLAVDIVEMNDDKIAQALAGTGWFQATWKNEIWHWSYGVRG